MAGRRIKTGAARDCPDGPEQRQISTLYLALSVHHKRRSLPKEEAVLSRVGSARRRRDAQLTGGLTQAAVRTILEGWADDTPFAFRRPMVRRRADEPNRVNGTALPALQRTLRGIVLIDLRRKRSRVVIGCPPSVSDSERSVRWSSCHVQAPDRRRLPVRERFAAPAPCRVPRPTDRTSRYPTPRPG